MTRSAEQQVTAIWEQLKTVLDPELFVSVVDLGLIYAVSVEGDTATIRMTLTTIGCPLFDTIEGEIKTKAALVPGVETVVVELTFDPPWDQSKISEAGRAELGLE